MRVLTAWLVALGLVALVMPAASAQGVTPPCARTDGTALRDAHWRDAQPAHPLIGQVHKSDGPIAIIDVNCTRSPLQQLIVEVWQMIRAGGVVLLGEVHDNPEQAVCDGPQALKPSKFDILMTELKLIAKAVGRSI